MRVDPISLLFEDIPDDVAVQMREATERMVLQGDVPHPDPPWLTLWLEAGGFDDRQRLMVLATVLPARVFLSLLRRQEALAAAPETLKFRPKYTADDPPQAGTRNHSGSGRYVVRLWDMLDGWCCTEPNETGVPWEEAVKLWLGKTRGGTKNTKFDDLDYWDIFPAESRMVVTPEYLGR